MTSQTPPPPPGPTTPGPPPGPLPGPQGPPPGGPQVAEFFDKIRAWGAVRPDDGRWAAGVAAALARRLGLDPLLVRGAFVVLTVFGGFGLFLYGIGWLFLPQPDGRIHAQEVLRGVVTAGFVGGALCLIADAGGGWAWGPRPFGGGFLGFVLVGLVVWWFVAGRHRGAAATPSGGSTPSSVSSPPAGSSSSTGTTSMFAEADAPSEPAAGPVPPYGTPPAPLASTYPSPNPPAWTPPAPARTPAVDRARPSHTLTSTVLGVALLGAGAVLLWGRVWGLPASSVTVAAAVALGIVALGVLVAGALGRRAGGLAPIGIVLAVTALVGSAPSSGDVDWAGDRTWSPTTVSGTSEYTLAAGNARLDLSRVVTTGATASAPAEIDARVGAGHLTVAVPAGLAVRILASTGAGPVEVDAPGLTATPGGRADQVARDGGHDVDVDVRSSASPVLLVRADVGLGNLSLVSANG
jgi:phage shock protein PspC (stress-responsive transcriptional regulator)